MTQCPDCLKIFDESEYTHCPYCSGELSGRRSSSRDFEAQIKFYDKELGRNRWVSQSEYEEDPDRYEEI